LDLYPDPGRLISLAVLINLGPLINDTGRGLWSGRLRRVCSRLQYKQRQLATLILFVDFMGGFKLRSIKQRRRPFRKPPWVSRRK
jgi:hypothetical protein